MPAKRPARRRAARRMMPAMDRQEAASASTPDRRAPFQAASTPRLVSLAVAQRPCQPAARARCGRNPCNRCRSRVRPCTPSIPTEASRAGARLRSAPADESPSAAPARTIPVPYNPGAAVMFPGRRGALPSATGGPQMGRAARRDKRSRHRHALARSPARIARRPCHIAPGGFRRVAQAPCTPANVSDLPPRATGRGGAPDTAGYNVPAPVAASMAVKRPRLFAERRASARHRRDPAT